MTKSLPYVLCVDDDPMNLEILEDHLEGLYEVKCVTNGQECLDAVEERKPDLILLDVMMPVLDGKETTKQLKASAKNKSIPIIVLSAKSYEDEIQAMFDLGVDSYLTKPFSRDRLLKRIADYLSVSRVV